MSGQVVFSSGVDVLFLPADISSLPINVSFSVQPDSQTQLLVHWAPPTSTTPTIDPLLILYEVVYVTPTSPPVSSGTLESYSRDYTITGLQAGTAYRVSVLVHLVGTSSGHSWVTASTYGNGNAYFITHPPLC